MSNYQKKSSKLPNIVYQLITVELSWNFPASDTTRLIKNVQRSPVPFRIQREYARIYRLPDFWRIQAGGREGGIVERNSVGGARTREKAGQEENIGVCSGNSSNDAFPKINFARWNPRRVWAVASSASVGKLKRPDRKFAAARCKRKKKGGGGGKGKYNFPPIPPGILISNRRGGGRDGQVNLERKRKCCCRLPRIC